jgi:peptidoglycan/xylan/chitin deacetylase (PgdA/CDA1 family)
VDAEVIMSDGSTQYFWLGSVSSSSDWSKFSTSFTTPSGAKSMAIYQILAKNGFVITDDYSLREYVPSGFSRALVSVTLDDGWASQYQNALPILNKYGLKATYYIISGSMGEQPYYMSADQVKNLYLQGMEIGSHTITHPDLTKVTQSQLVNEMSQSQTTMQNVIGAPVLNFAYPYGAYNSATVSVGKQYYNSQRSVDQGLNTKDSLDFSKLKIYEVDYDVSQTQVQSWIDSAIAENAWLILVYHEVGSNYGGGKYHVDSSTFDSQMSYLKNTGVATVTVGQAISELSAQL